ncbi:putative tRNA (guanine(10)-N2)-dimethyltransferase [Orchesella cincta]|uniref:Putative tRNA (Guanine(10)-N2)-dimethyltransferase n=1 Tax=Orchesella cincta TaxID=48709 RepID=A0A1D2N8D3_ORCCI|nr:putative tRNA (guanine(10)-N2)-dimethyltransferase [Orchesella cincta]
MGAEEKNQPETPQNVGAVETAEATVMPPEEPPKMEDIVTADVLQDIIKGYNKPDMKLVSFDAQPGSNIGDNYMSIMYALEIQLQNEKSGEKETLHVMLKTIPRNVFRIEMINEMKAFQKEAIIYQQVFPMLVETQKEKEVPSSELFTAWPICYATHVDGATDYLAMENLKIAGFQMGSRTAGLDFNHCNLVLRNLAKYHAISFAKFNGDRQKILEYLPVLNTSMFDPESKISTMQQQFMEQSFQNMAKNLRGEGYTEAAIRLEKMAASQFSVTLNSLIQENIEYAVVTHGDCWVNNILFNYDGDDSNKSAVPKAVKFLDFQLCQATSRLIDIYYFLMTSAKLDTINEREQDLLMAYYTEFTSFAERLGINTHERGLTYENFLKEVDHFRLYGVFMGLLLAPMLAANAEDIPDMEAMTEEDFSGKSEENSKKFIEDIYKGKANKKVECLVMKHLPKCNQGAAYCSQ